MQLKKLEMCGFKSFAGKTEVLFEKGVTGVVGPNGCGKSNIVDAIRWVLGTQSSKAIRGDEMLDVIFKGAPGVAPMGYADVSLTLDNADRTLEIDYQEVVIARRLHRDGTSEYLLNRTPVRLKDIRDLLYGTGIGTDNYSIIEQGKIDRLVTSNPRERRLVFDEAAGVSKYRARRHETELRLDKVNQDLLRLQDVVHEVQRELRGVRIQAGRATRYREMEQEYRDKRLRLLVHDRDAIRERGAEMRTRRSELESRLAELEQAVAARRDEVARIETDLAALDERHAKLAAALAGIESKEHYLRKSVEQGAERLGELDAAGARARKDLESHEAKARDLEAQERRCREEAEAARKGVCRLEEEIAEAQERVEEAQRECRRLEDEIEHKRAEAVESAHKEAQHRTESARVEDERASLDARLERATARAGESGDEHAEILLKLWDIDGQVGTAEAALGELHETREREAGALEELKRRRGDLDARLEDLRRVHESNVAKAETLHDLESEREGLEAGVRALLGRKGDEILGTVADLIDVEPSALTAIEQAVGERAGFVVCRDGEAARAAADAVRETPGRTGIVSLADCRDFGAPPVPGYAGVIGRASDFVRCAPEHRPLAEALLGSVWLVESGDSAEALLRAGLALGTLVTREGDCYEPPGILRTGRPGNGGLLSRKAELRRLEREIEEASALLARAEAERDENGKRTRTAEEKLELARQSVYERMVALNDAQKERDQMEKRRTYLEDEILALNGEVADMLSRRATLAQRAGALRGLLEGAVGLREQIEGEIASHVETGRKYREALSRLQEDATARRVRRGQEQEKAAALGKRLSNLEEDLEYVREALRNTREQIDEVAARRQTVVEERERNARELECLAGEMADLRRQVAEVEEARRSRAAAAEESRGGAAELEREEQESSAALQDLRVEESEQRLKEEHLAQRAREEYGLELQGAEMPPSDPPVDWSLLGAEVEELRRKIQSFGSVNIVALEQLKELEERAKYLLAQQEDLVNSKTQLEELIRKLNRESRELFEKALEQVREHFSAIFRKVFGGGKAEIVVQAEEGVDPMDYGLEILVRPPNKEISTLRLMSGGERSLTAIALVLALFKANPSPFCVLDEADAALDENNVGKYAALVREFAAETQFIVITHNQRTMASCDVLYGVTMEMPGVSKRVKVDLRGDGNLDLVRRNAAGPDGAGSRPEPEAATGTATATLDPGQEE